MLHFAAGASLRTLVWPALRVGHTALTELEIVLKGALSAGRPDNAVLLARFVTAMRLFKPFFRALGVRF